MPNYELPCPGELLRAVYLHLGLIDPEQDAEDSNGFATWLPGLDRKPAGNRPGPPLWPTEIRYREGDYL